MAKQLIFCSVPHGLQPGRSGYCLMAGHTDLPQSLIRQLEQETSVFPSEIDENHAPTYQIRRSGGAEWHLFMRQTTGIKDYTGRSSGLTHVLVERAEHFPRGLDPKTVLWSFKHWVTDLPDQPRAFNAAEEISFDNLVTRTSTSPPTVEAPVSTEPVAAAPAEEFKINVLSRRDNPSPRPRSGIYYDGPTRRQTPWKWILFAGLLMMTGAVVAAIAWWAVYAR